MEVKIATTATTAALLPLTTIQPGKYVALQPTSLGDGVINIESTANTTKSGVRRTLVRAEVAYVDPVSGKRESATVYQVVVVPGASDALVDAEGNPTAKAKAIATGVLVVAAMNDTLTGSNVAAYTDAIALATGGSTNLVRRSLLGLDLPLADRHYGEI